MRHSVFCRFPIDFSSSRSGCFTTLLRLCRTRKRRTLALYDHHPVAELCGELRRKLGSDFRKRGAETPASSFRRLVAQFESEQFCTELGDASVAGCRLRSNGPRSMHPPPPHRAGLFRGAWMSDQSREAKHSAKHRSVLEYCAGGSPTFLRESRHVRRGTNAR